MQVWHEKWKNTMNSPFCCTNPHFLPSSTKMGGVIDQSWQGQKLLGSSSRTVRIWRCPKSESTISWEGELSGFSFPYGSEHDVISARHRDNGAYLGSKNEAVFAEILRIRSTAGHGRSVFYLRVISDYVSGT